MRPSLLLPSFLPTLGTRVPYSSTKLMEACQAQAFRPRPGPMPNLHPPPTADRGGKKYALVRPSVRPSLRPVVKSSRQ